MNNIRSSIVAISSFIMLVTVSACGDATQSSEAGEGEDASPGLALSVADRDRVAGTFEVQGRRLAFDAWREGECDILDVKDGDGRFVLGARSCPDGDSIELADRGVIPFPAGALAPAMVDGPPRAVAADPRDEARVAELASDGTYEGLRALTDAMKEHPLFAEAAGTTQSSPEIAGGLSPQTHDPGGCAACHGSCAAAEAACVFAVGWTPAIVLCGVAAMICHPTCAMTVCQ
ncbi:hypothetical protein [Sorangium sp. So ce1078]|uniref:hypothetical protein n=1 Tax=Sorangium sp. So ce1078 TaxID=3133329 RepID=UPI003F600752